MIGEPNLIRLVNRDRQREAAPVRDLYRLNRDFLQSRFRNHISGLPVVQAQSPGSGMGTLRVWRL
jgi:hypothetical protein